MLFLSGPSHDKGSPKVKQMGPPGPLWKISTQPLAGEENPKEVRLKKKKKKNQRNYHGVQMKDLCTAENLLLNDSDRF